MSFPTVKAAAKELVLEGVMIPGKPSTSRWNICCKNGYIESIDERQSESPPGSNSPFLIPSLCHPHIHLDKAFLLSHPKYADLEIQKGDFAEAMSLTSGCKFYSLSVCSHVFPSQARQSLDLSMMISWNEDEPWSKKV